MKFRPKTVAGRYARSSSDVAPDERLEHQLEKLKLRKEANDPHIRRKKHMEKLLLEVACRLISFFNALLSPPPDHSFVLLLF